jgi:hypothetical protein
MRRSSFLVGLVPVAAFAAMMFGSTKEAHAGPTIGLDLNLGTAFQDRARSNTSTIDFSYGLGGRLGYRFHFPGTYVYLQPELGGSYMNFGANSSQAGGYSHAGALNGGARLGLSGIVQPHVFGHIGLGFLGYDSVATTRSGAVITTSTDSYLGPAFDVGLGLDIRVVRGFTLGALVAYNSVTVPSVNTIDAAKWVSFGLHAGFEFGAPGRARAVRRVYIR